MPPRILLCSTPLIHWYLISVILLWRLMEQVDLIPPSIKHLRFDRFLRNGFLLLMRVIAVTFCVMLAASLAPRHGSTSMAAFQVILQIWLAVSLLADGLAVAGQAILVGAFANKDYEKATATASRVLQMGLVLGVGLAFILGTGLHFGAKLFTKDVKVLHLIRIGIPYIALTQPLNSLAFIFDGINFGASDFAYSTFSMVAVAIISIVCLLIMSSAGGFIGIWIVLEGTHVLLTGGVEKILRIYDLNRPDAPPREVDKSPGSVRTVAWLHSDKTILSSCTDMGGVRDEELNENLFKALSHVQEFTPTAKCCLGHIISVLIWN